MLKKIKKIPGWTLKILIGALFVQSPLLAIFAIGWTYRYMQRTALNAWWGMRENTEGPTTFFEFTNEHDPFTTHERTPNWILEQRPLQTAKERNEFTRGTFKKFHGMLQCLYASLKKNFKIGIVGYFNIMVATIIPTILWQFGWYSGWDNSFNKGYEQATYGIFISITGIVLFIAVMFYLPMAQARHAITGEWKAFYQFRIVRSLIKTRPLSCLYLAGLYSLISFPLTIFKSVPLFIGNINPDTETMTNLELFEYMQSYFFYTGIAFFIGYIILHRIAANIYAKALIEALAKNSITINDLSSWEIEVLSRLSLVQTDSSAEPHIAIKVAKTVVRPAWKTGLTVGTILIWFSFIAQIYASEFLVYHPLHGWLNQPLIQMPWYNYTPTHLKKPSK